MIAPVAAVTVGDVFVVVLLVIGVAALVLACLGVLLMEDVLDRLHFTGPSTVGAIAIAAAIAVREGPSLIADKAVFVAVLLAFTSPVLVNATARAARSHRRGDWRLGEDEEVEVEER